MYDCKCPIYGQLNEHLYLEETNGWMECERCHSTAQILQYAKFQKVTVLKASVLSSPVIREVVGCI